MYLDFCRRLYNSLIIVRFIQGRTMVKKVLKKTINIKVLFALLLLANLLVIVFTVSHKQAFHSDEQWSYAHANSSKGAYLDRKIDSFYQINDNIRQRLFNRWINGKTFNDYLTVQPEERFSYGHIYKNLQIVEHPPLYFLLLHTVSSLFPDSFNKWHAGTINILLFILIYISLFKLSELMLKDKKLALLSVALWGFSEIGLDTAVFLRMYVLQTLFSVCLVYETIKIIQENAASRKQLGLVFLYSFLGIFTQYNSVFFSFFVAFATCLILLKRKNYRLMFQYGGIMALSVMALFAAFPAAWNVLFGSMRGKQVLSAMSRTPDIGDNILNLLWRIDLTLSRLIDMFARHFFAFDGVNYQLLSFLLILTGGYSILCKQKMAVSTKLLLSVAGLYCVYLLSMPYMAIFHSRYFMNVAPFVAILAVMLLSWLLRQARLNADMVILCVGLLVGINSLRTDFAHQSPYAFRWGAAEYDTAAKIKDNKVFINAGEDVIALHSMIYYLKNAQKVYITEDICDSRTLSEIKKTATPIVLTYSSYILSPSANSEQPCLQNIGLHKTATICPSQRCYNVWEKDKRKSE